MLDIGFHQAAGLHSFTPQSELRVVAVASQDNAGTGLETLWQICASLQRLGYPVVVLDGTAQETDDSPGLLHLLQHLIHDFSYVGKIKSLIANDIENFPEFEEVAQQLHMTPRTLRRHLRREGRSYQEIKNDIRRDAAIYYLTRKGMAIADVAEQTGFSDTSTFIRAFKAWTGVTPYVYRKQVEGAD